MARAGFDPKAKERRQKIILAVGSVVLLALLALQGPKTLKRLNPPEAPAAPATTALPAAAKPTASGTAPTSSPAAGSALPDSDATPAALPGQLVSFELFRSKDPFVPQVAAESAGTAAGGSEPASGGPAPPPEAPAAKPASESAAAGFSQAGSSATPAGEGSERAPSSARISTNGAVETVAVSKSFPAAEPVFRLVSLTRDSASIAIVGGSYDSGAATVTLKKGKPLTLMNSADRKRYRLRLLSTS